jgi:hypothetical protein
MLRFGLHALSVAREASVCPVFLALLRRPPLELEWLFSESDRTNRVARLLLGLYAAVRAVAADPKVDGDTRAGLLKALARLRGRVARHARRLWSCSPFDREVDRDDWLEDIRAGADHLDDPERFVSASLVPFDDPTRHLGW